MHGITLDKEHHNGHLNKEEKDFEKCVPVMIHAESELEARAVAEFVSEQFDWEEPRK